MVQVRKKISNTCTSKIPFIQYWIGLFLHSAVPFELKKTASSSLQDLELAQSFFLCAFLVVIACNAKTITFVSPRNLILRTLLRDNPLYLKWPHLDDRFVPWACSKTRTPICLFPLLSLSCSSRPRYGA